MRRLLPLLAVACALAFVPAAQAQAPEPTLEHGVATASATAQGAIAIDVPWTYTGPSAAASVGDAGLDVSWAADCQGATGATAGRFTPAPGQATVSGVSGLRFEAPGLEPAVPALCVLTGHAESAVPGSAADTELSVTVVVPVAFNVTVDVKEPTKTAAPQKAVPYPVEVTNHGNGRVVVRFETVGDPRHGRWFLLAPDAVALDPGQSTTVPVTVATTFHNGYVKGQRDFLMRATPESRDGSEVGEAVEFGLHTNVQGFYIPGPSPVLVGALLAGLALLVRRR